MAFANNRLELHQKLIDLLGNSNVYFQPPESVRLQYPCVIYNRETGDSQYADNSTYKFFYRYQIIYIDRSPDSDFVVRLLKELPMAVYDRHYTMDNLNHDVVNVYF